MHIALHRHGQFRLLPYNTHDCFQRTIFKPAPRGYRYSLIALVIFCLTLFVPRVTEGSLSSPNFYFMYNIWQDDETRIRVAATSSKTVLQHFFKFFFFLVIVLWSKKGNIYNIEKKIGPCDLKKLKLCRLFLIEPLKILYTWTVSNFWNRKKCLITPPYSLVFIVTSGRSWLAWLSPPPTLSAQFIPGNLMIGGEDGGQKSCAGAAPPEGPGGSDGQPDFL